ncbi:BIR7B protein, partial [Rhinopomastus cyanomelas]|nr:BIR7B protein [Rhinopomastus cyanomelas]
MGERTPIEEAEHRAACCVLYESRMRSEARRLRTFYEWPSTSPVSALDLVKAGFFFVGPRDAVQCFCCGVVLDSWESGDCPIVEHKKYLPSCRFVCGEDVGNQEMHSHQETFDTVDGQLLSLLQGVDTGTTSLLRLSEYPEMGTEEMRLSTFQNWPQYAGTNPERLARAGFFYTGIGDLVRCFHCGGGLTNWSIGDDPWMEHASLFPDCEFLLQSRGREFVSSIQESFSNTQLSQSRMSTEEQLRRLQQERMCKVCMDRDVSVVFVPCGHLVACGECAINLRLCPICRAIIRESVRTFMS